MASYKLALFCLVALAVAQVMCEGKGEQAAGVGSNILHKIGGAVDSLVSRLPFTGNFTTPAEKKEEGAEKKEEAASGDKKEEGEEKKEEGEAKAEGEAKEGEEAKGEEKEAKGEEKEEKKDEEKKDEEKKEE